jgi:hypothetical protein
MFATDLIPGVGVRHSDRGRLALCREAAMTTPSIVASTLRLITGNHIIGIVDITIVPWQLTFRGCRWRNDETGKHVTLGLCDDACFSDDATAQRFQAAALTAVRALAREVVGL